MQSPQAFSGSRWVAIGFFLLTALVYVSTASPAIVNTDAEANSVTAWHLAQNGSPFFDDVDPPTIKGPTYFIEGAGGRIVTARSPGQIWAATPFYLGASEDVDEVTVHRGSIAAAVLTALAMTLLLLTLMTELPPLGALAATSVVAFATPVWSVSADALWTHCVTLLGISGFAYSLARGRSLGGGLWMGVSILARAHTAIVAAVVGLGLSVARRDVRLFALTAAGSGLGLGVLIAWNKFVFGEWTVAGGYGSHSVDAIASGESSSRLGYNYAEQFAGFLVSADRGFLVWTPLLLLAAPLAWRHRKALPDWSLWLGLGGAAYLVVQVGVNEFTGGAGFDGYRLALEPLLCVAPAMAFSARQAGPFVRSVAPWLIGYQFAFVAFGAVLRGFWTDPESEMWLTNSIVSALRIHPTVYLPVMLVFFTFAFLAARVVIRHLAVDRHPADVDLVLKD